MKRVLPLLILSLLLMVTPLWAATGPTMEVKSIVDSVLEVLNRSDIDYAAKRQAVSGVVQSHINILSISQRTLGVHWKKATPEQQQRFSNLLTTLEEQDEQLMQVELWLNELELSSGKHSLEFRCTGKNEASRGYSLGFDMLELKPLD